MHDHWLARIQEVGYKLTAPRKALLKALTESKHSLSALELHETAKVYHSKLGLVTVYRTLEVLEKLGLVRRVHTEGACHGYAASSPGHRHAVICDRCSQAVEFDGEEVCQLTAGVEQKTGYQINGHWLQLTGLCPTCRQVGD